MYSYITNRLGVMAWNKYLSLIHISDAFFRGLGYRYVCMDLHGFATGSMNAAIGKDGKGE